MRSALRWSSSRSGVTLAEVLIAGAIMALALVAVGRAVSTGRRSVTMAQRQAQALHAARAALEDLMDLSFHDAALAAGRHTISNGHYDVTVVDAYTKDIVVRMSWRGPHNSTNWVELTTSMSSSTHYY